MPFMTQVVDVAIASPGDVRDARRAVELEVISWNGLRSQDEQLTYRVRTWELDTVPLAGSYPQGVINDQVVDRADVLIALFRGRLGTPTARDISGTVEEIHRSLRANRPVHVYFSVQKLPHDVDVEQLTALRAFRAELAQHSLVATFTSTNDLRDQIRRALDFDARQLGRARP